ncbi:4-coumarate--CoA ligase family protein [Saccharothrix violaceirubra]|uniref:Acyl-CoA synthetase (AMP-forming)/AMP-acid ligase II n=1 Tax=Saccharothrix violaceirubra TaxID=413306 RepID=A0A7W7SXE0_9PSEU|nr:AMP-binding protein [Saccharothrix violaceirubra]MBB4962740.1 acyl-CoA synthetase (AMP-forming)/AMP-acid ligase II [Saccharothrix violaceirubra]
MVFRSPFPDVAVPDVTLHDFLFRDRTSTRVALVDGVGGRSLTYAELAEAVERLAFLLVSRGIGRGDVVGILAPNDPYYAVVFHGILRAGATATTINTLYTDADVAFQLRDAGVKLLFSARPVDFPDTIPFSDLPELLMPGAAPEVPVSPDDVAVLPYSSGTTGRAKGVMLTHRNLVANIVQCGPLLKVESDSRILAVLPFFHIYGMQVLMNLGLHMGATVVTLPKFDLAEFLRVIQDHRTDRVYIAPPVAVALAKHPLVDQYDLSAVDTVFSGAAPLDVELAEAVARRLDCHVRQGYGMTEMSPVSHAIPDGRDDIPVGTVGFIAPNMECRFVDPASGADVGVGERGELWCRGPNVMKGYLNDPEATAVTLDSEGWLHTGDVAVIDSAGAVTIVDRVKELIKYKGYQVPPAELEALLLTHPAVVDAAVVGVQVADVGEVPKAFVVRADNSLTEADVIAFVAEHVAPYKKVRQVEFISAIPKSASGKILRKDLRGRDVV